MKKLLLIACAAATALSAVRADDIALFTVKVGTDKTPKQFAIEFYDADAPQTVENFKKLTHKKFYNGVSIHRVFPHILVQTGDPLSKGKDRAKVGTGGPGYTIPPEIHRKHTTGAVAMGRLPDNINPGRLSNGSQFVICLAPMPSYDGQYTVFGNVFQGLDVLDQISEAAVDSNDNPLKRVEITSGKIIPREQLSSARAVAAPALKSKKPWWKIF
jgi:peptidyl-prolyl cis-trans isomerase B (cyclophilin B)